MAIGDDFSISSTGDIRYTGTTTNYTVLELHQWLQNLADDAAATGDDILSIASQTPSERSTDNIITLVNGFNVDDVASQHLYDGSIIQTGGDEIYDGLVVVGNCTFVQIMQDGALISTANDFWNDNTPTGLNPDTANGISHRFMLKVRTGGADIDGRRLIALTREFGNTYAEFSINGTARGNNVIALSEQDDLNNETAEGTVATWDQFANTEGYQLIDVIGDGSADEPYYSKWAIGGGATPASPGINDLYEWTKHASRRGSTSTLYGLVQSSTAFRGVTHEIEVDTPTGTFAAVEAVSWSGGTGQMLAINSTTAPTKMWIQLLTGVAPTDGQTITGSGTCDVNVTVTERTPVPQPFIGQSTGSAIIGGYGVGVDDTDLTFPDKLTDLDNTLREAPNNVTFTVEGLAAGDSVLVTQYDGVGDIDKDQYTLNTSLTGAAETSVVITGSIDSDTPQSGIAVRVVNDSGYDVRLPVSSWTGSTFTVSSYDFSGTDENDAATAPKNVYVDYIDTTSSGTTESFQVVYTADRTLFVRVRDGAEPIKTFETTATLGSSGGSATAIRNPDS